MACILPFRNLDGLAGLRSLRPHHHPPSPTINYHQLPALHLRTLEFSRTPFLARMPAHFLVRACPPVGVALSSTCTRCLCVMGGYNLTRQCVCMRVFARWTVCGHVVATLPLYAHQQRDTPLNPLARLQQQHRQQPQRYTPGRTQQHTLQYERNRPSFNLHAKHTN